MKKQTTTTAKYFTTTARCDAFGFPPNARASYEHDNVCNVSGRPYSGRWDLIINFWDVFERMS